MVLFPEYSLDEVDRNYRFRRSIFPLEVDTRDTLFIPDLRPMLLDKNTRILLVKS